MNGPEGLAGDPGLQVERTALAWQRTGVSASGVGALALLVAAHGRIVWLVAVTGLLAAASAVAALAAARSGTALTRRLHVRTGPVRADSPWPRLVATAAATVLVALCGLLVAVV